MFFLDLVHASSNAKLNKNKECGLKRRILFGEMGHSFQGASHLSVSYAGPHLEDMGHDRG